MGVFAALGYPEIASHLVSRCREKGHKGLLPAIVNHALKTTAVCAAIATVAVLAFVAFWPNVALLSVVGAQRRNAMLAVGARVVLALANLGLVPSAGVVGAPLALALATIVWLIASAVAVAH